MKQKNKNKDIIKCQGCTNGFSNGLICLGCNGMGWIIPDSIPDVKSNKKDKDE